MCRRSRPNWLDLPQGIFEIVVNKLHFVDQVRALAVCKTWRDCKDYVRCSDTLPLVMCCERRPSVQSELMCELFDPYSRKDHKLSSTIDIHPGLEYVPLASKRGWACGFFCCMGLSFVYLHNPFTNEIHSVFSIEFGYSVDIQAAIKVNPTSPECELFTFVLSGNDNELYMYTKKPSGTTSEFIVEMCEDEVLYSVLYMNDNIYCLFWDGTLNGYSLQDKSWKLLTSGFPNPYEKGDAMEDCWLIEINENLMMVRLDYDGEWIIFRFDWSKMSWVIEHGLKNCAIYISGNVAFSAPLSNRHGQILESCKVFFLDEYDGDFKCYSMSKATRSKIQSEEYNWISITEGCEFFLIEPPYFGI